MNPRTKAKQVVLSVTNNEFTGVDPMTPLRKRMIEDMQLRGLSANTQENYVRTVRDLANYYNTLVKVIEQLIIQRSLYTAFYWIRYC